LQVKCLMFNTEGASCVGLDPDIFFPTNSMDSELEELLKKICMRCPIFESCLDYALNVKVSGFWAGTTELNRVELRRYFGINPLRIDQEYKNLVDKTTPTNKRNSHKAQKEEG